MLQAGGKVPLSPGKEATHFRRVGFPEGSNGYHKDSGMPEMEGWLDVNKEIYDVSVLDLVRLPFGTQCSFLATLGEVATTV